MVGRRFLGGAYASVHGPQDPRGLWVFVLERGFHGLVAAPGPRAIDWHAVKAASAKLPVGFAGVRVASALELEGPGDGSLASTHAGERAAARRRVRAAAELALRLGCARVILDPGTARVAGEPGPQDLGDPALAWSKDRARAQLARRNVGLDQALDAACRSLFECARRCPEVELCLSPSRHAFGLGDPDALAAIFSDLGTRLSYWHDTALAARREQLLGTPQGEWLERFAGRMSGLTLGDSVDGALYLPPGMGGVDYPLVAAYGRRLATPLPMAIELDPGADPGELPGLHAFLDKYGL